MRAERPMRWSRWGRESRKRGPRVGKRGESAWETGRRGRAVFYRGKAEEPDGKSGHCGAKPDGGTAGNARPEGAGVGQERVGGRRRQSDGLMGAVSGAPPAVVWNTSSYKHYKRSDQIISRFNLLWGGVSCLLSTPPLAKTFLSAVPPPVMGPNIFSGLSIICFITIVDCWK